MVERLWRRLTYRLERWIVRGAQYRLAVVAAAIGLISVLGGALVLWWGAGFADFGDAVWWAFLRLTDPGYLGDDVGVVNRTLSTVLTVAGYVVFLGALVAVMTQWLNARMALLEAGLTPVARNDHVLVLGWTNRTETLIEELLRSEGRVRRFLRRHGAHELHVVVLAREVSAARVQDLRDAVGEVWDERKVTLRSGSPIRMEHLARGDYRNAAAVIIPGTEFEAAGAVAGDIRTLKTLLSLAAEPEDGHPGEVPGELPYTVAEIFDARKAEVARHTYPGELEVVVSDALISRLVAQNVRHPGLSEVYAPILSHGEGAELYLREAPQLAGLPAERLASAFPGGILLGVVRRGASGYRTHLNPPAGFETEAEDRYVVLSESWEAAAPTGEPAPGPSERGAPGGSVGAGDRRVLLLGWNRRVPTLVREFGTYEGERHRLHVVSTVAAERRRQAIERAGGPGARVEVRHSEADFTDPAHLATLAPADYDAVVTLGSDRLTTEEESDARSIVGSLLLQELLAADGGGGEGPSLLMELLDPENVPLVNRSRAEVIISPLVLSHMLAHVALRRELRAVFEELFTAGGAELTFRPLASYGLDGPGPVTFSSVRAAASAAGETAIGVRTPEAGVLLAPSDALRVAGGPATQAVSLVTTG